MKNAVEYVVECVDKATRRCSYAADLREEARGALGVRRMHLRGASEAYRRRGLIWWRLAVGTLSDGGAAHRAAGGNIECGWGVA
jgi:hypothetical protein